MPAIDQPKPASPDLQGREDVRNAEACELGAALAAIVAQHAAPTDLPQPGGSAQEQAKPGGSPRKPSDGDPAGTRAGGSASIDGGAFR